VVCNVYSTSIIVANSSFLARTRVRRKKTSRGTPTGTGDRMQVAAPSLPSMPITLASPAATTASGSTIPVASVDVSDDSDEYKSTMTAPSSTASRPSKSKTVTVYVSSDDEFMFSDIEFTEALIAVLDAPIQTPTMSTAPSKLKTAVYVSSDDEFMYSDIELDDALIAVLDAPIQTPTTMSSSLSSTRSSAEKI
jgi:hypothetical protein